MRRCVLILACVMALHARGWAVTSGVASWYGDKFAGKTMANGQPFNPAAYTCASRTHPLGAKLRITYPRTKLSVIVVVTDRGPWIPGRVLDLSEAAAEAIGLRAYGIGQVTIEEVQNEDHVAHRHWWQ